MLIQNFHYDIDFSLHCGQLFHQGIDFSLISIVTNFAMLGKDLFHWNIDF